MNNLTNLTDNKVLYAAVSVLRCKSTKVTVIRAKSNAFLAASAERTAQLVADATGFEQPRKWAPSTDAPVYQ